MLDDQQAALNREDNSKPQLERSTNLEFKINGYNEPYRPLGEMADTQDLGSSDTNNKFIF
jgi:hypothetical protein